MAIIYNTILENRKKNKKMLAVLLDPDKCTGELMKIVIFKLKKYTPHFILVGGSHTNNSTDNLVEVLKKEVNTNVVLFPGNASQFSENADALLYLSLISGRNPEFLIGQHVHSALAIKKSNIEVIPTGYLLVEGGKSTSVEYISNTRPIPNDKDMIAVSTAIAGELLGMKLIYLEAGSGANIPVPISMIKNVRAHLSVPLIVGGGIRIVNDIIDAFDSGADIVVVGNVFESKPELIEIFMNTTNHYNERIK